VIGCHERLNRLSLLAEMLEPNTWTPTKSTSNPSPVSIDQTLQLELFGQG
jgi:hypothetical protein